MVRALLCITEFLSSLVKVLPVFFSPLHLFAYNSKVELHKLMMMTIQYRYFQWFSLKVSQSVDIVHNARTYKSSEKAPPKSSIVFIDWLHTKQISNMLSDVIVESCWPGMFSMVRTSLFR